MLIDDLIADLQKVREKKGNIEVVASSFCGTNNSLVVFTIEPRKSPIKDNLSEGKTYHLSVVVSETSKAGIKAGVADMIARGYQFFLSQFVESGKQPKAGLSPCDWHGLW